MKNRLFCLLVVLACALMVISTATAKNRNLCRPM